MFESESRESLQEEYPYFVKRIGEERHNDLICLINSYNLQDYQNDLLYMAYKIGLIGMLVPIGISGQSFVRGYRQELSDLLEVINSSKLNLEVVFRDKAYNKRASASNHMLIKKIAKLIKELHDKEMIQPESLIKPQGRKQKHNNLGHFAHMLQSYLQQNTYLKAKAGIHISDKQVEFIYSFLLYLGILEDSADMGYIRKYLIKFKKNKSQ